MEDEEIITSKAFMIVFSRKQSPHYINDHHPFEPWVDHYRKTSGLLEANQSPSPTTTDWETGGVELSKASPLEGDDVISALIHFRDWAQSCFWTIHFRHDTLEWSVSQALRSHIVKCGDDNWCYMESNWRLLESWRSTRWNGKTRYFPSEMIRVVDYKDAPGSIKMEMWSKGT